MLVSAFQRYGRRLPADSAIRRRLTWAAVVRATAALNRGDVDACLLSHEPDVELNMIGWRGVVSEHYHGHAGFRQLVDEWADGMDVARWSVEDVSESPDQMLIKYRFEGRGKSTGIDVRQTIGYVLTFAQSGKVAVQDMYWNWPEAEAAVYSFERGPVNRPSGSP